MPLSRTALNKRRADTERLGSKESKSPRHRARPVRTPGWTPPSRARRSQFGVPIFVIGRLGQVEELPLSGLHSWWANPGLNEPAGGEIFSSTRR